MTAGSLKLEDVQQISEEIRWLVRSRLPLEQHLASAGQGTQLQKLTRSITEGLDRGEPLAEIVRSQKQGVPRMLASAVAAGVRAGDLAASVEMMGDMASDLVDLRRQVVSAITYPLTIVLSAWLLFVLLLQQALIRIWDSAQSLGVQFHPLASWLMNANHEYQWWPWVIPAIAFSLLVLWVISGRASAMAFRGPELLFLLLPGVGGLLRDLRFSTLARMMSLLIERQVPLPEAVRIAGACCGSRSLDRACQAAAATLESGRPLSQKMARRWSRGQLPPLLRTCLFHNDGDGDRFAVRLRAVAEHYQARIELSSMWLKMLMPMCLFALIAGGTVIIYSLSIFWPMREIYDQLGFGSIQVFTGF